MVSITLASYMMERVLVNQRGIPSELHENYNIDHPLTPAPMDWFLHTMVALIDNHIFVLHIDENDGSMYVVLHDNWHTHWDIYTQHLPF